MKTVKDYISIHNAHDIEGSLKYFNPDAVFELKGVWTKQGLADIGGLEEFDAVMNSHLEIKNIRASADTVYCKIVENNNWFSTLGINDLVHDPVIFVIGDNKIKHIIAYPDQETSQAIEAAIGRIFEWSQKNGDSTIFRLLPNGEFQYSTEAGVQWKALFESMQVS
ncbi:MAG: hypothetical protein ABF293_00365, partial [Flavobacteriaceae bacterium]